MLNMKRLSVTILCLISFIFMAQSQDSRKVTSVEPQFSDILNVFEMMDINIFGFDLSPFLDTKYSVSVYVDEYKNNKKVNRNHTINIGNNIESLKDVPEEHRASFREQKQIPEGKNEWDKIKNISVYIRNMNDSTSIISIVVPNAVKTGTQVKLYPLGDFKRHFYKVRPFSFAEVGQEDFVDIPLILYGSGWLDGQMIRFCGESEIDPDMKAEILANIPHHYVLGLELKKVE